MALKLESTYLKVLVDKLWVAGGLTVIGIGLLLGGKQDLGLALVGLGWFLTLVVFCFVALLYRSIGVYRLQTLGNRITITRPDGKSLMLDRLGIRHAFEFNRGGIYLVRLTTESGVIWFTDEGFRDRDAAVLRTVLKPRRHHGSAA